MLTVWGVLGGGLVSVMSEGQRDMPLGGFTWTDWGGPCADREGGILDGLVETPWWVFLFMLIMEVRTGIGGNIGLATNGYGVRGGMPGKGLNGMKG